VFAQKSIQSLQIDPILKLPLWQVKKGWMINDELWMVRL
jgi:hypothetical protein